MFLKNCFKSFGISKEFTLGNFVPWPWISQKYNLANLSVGNRLCSTSQKRVSHVSKTSWKRVHINSLTWWYVFKTSWRHLCKTSWIRFEDVLARRLEDVLKMSWKRCKDVLKTCDQDEYIFLDQGILKTSSEDVWQKQYSRLDRDVFNSSWKRLLKTRRFSNLH